MFAKLSAGIVLLLFMPDGFRAEHAKLPSFFVGFYAEGETVNIVQH